MAKYEGDDPSLQELQDRADAIEEMGVIPGDDVPASDEVPGTGDSVVSASEPDEDRPSNSASRADWDEYAESKGLDPGEYSTKEDLIAAVDSAAGSGSGPRISGEGDKPLMNPAAGGGAADDPQ